MSRRMIDPNIIIKSQIVDDNWKVDLLELLEKYGAISLDPDYSYLKGMTLQIYSQVSDTDNYIVINVNGTQEAVLFINTAITVTKDQDDNRIIISGFMVDDKGTMNFMNYVEIQGGAYEDGIHLMSPYPMDIHLIRV